LIYLLARPAQLGIEFISAGIVRTALGGDQFGSALGRSFGEHELLSVGLGVVARTQQDLSVETDLKFLAVGVRRCQVELHERAALLHRVAVGHVDRIDNSALQVLDHLALALGHHFARGHGHFVELGKTGPGDEDAEQYNHRPGDEQEKRQDDQQDPAQGLGNDKDERQENDDERQVRHQHGAGPRKRIANRIDVTEERLPIGSRHGFQRLQRQGHQFFEERAADVNIDPERHGLQDAPARGPEDVIDAEHSDHADQQAVQGAEAALEHHPVVNLHREDRHRQSQQIHEKGQRHDLAERRPQWLEKRPQPPA
jgi:hypothetical protein